MKPKLLPFALLAPSQTVLSRQSLGAGRQVPQIPPSPVFPKMASAICRPPENAHATPKPGAAKIVVNKRPVTGVLTCLEAGLVTLTGFKLDREPTLADLRAQEVSDGVITVAMLQGWWGHCEKSTFRKQRNLSDELIYSQLYGSNTGASSLERRLPLLSDISGVNVTRAKSAFLKSRESFP